MSYPEHVSTVEPSLSNESVDEGRARGSLEYLKEKFGDDSEESTEKEVH